MKKKTIKEMAKELSGEDARVFTWLNSKCPDIDYDACDKFKNCYLCWLSRDDAEIIKQYKELKNEK